MSQLVVLTENNLVQAVLCPMPVPAVDWRVVRCIWPMMPERQMLAKQWGLWRVLTTEWFAAKARASVPPGGVVLKIGGTTELGQDDRARAVVQWVAARHGLAEAELMGRSRVREIAEARHVAVYLARQITGISWPRLGRIMGRDHSGVMHSDAVTRDLLSVDPAFRARVTKLAGEAMRRDVGLEVK